MFTTSEFYEAAGPLTRSAKKYYVAGDILRRMCRGFPCVPWVAGVIAELQIIALPRFQASTKPQKAQTLQPASKYPTV